MTGPVDSSLLDGLDGAALPLPLLTSVLQSLDSTSHGEVVAVEIESDILQPGSHSGVLRLSLVDGAASRVFIKKITARHAPMAERPWPDRRRTLAYARTESRFYQEFAADGQLAQRLARMGVRLPRLGLSDNRLDAILGNTALHDVAGDEPSPEVQEAAGALLFLECAVGLMQASPVSERQARQALRAVAALHAAGWEDAATLRRASQRLQRHGGVYALEIRSPAELTRLRPNWDDFVAEFRATEPALFDNNPGVLGLGERLDRWARFASEQVSPGPDDRFATLVHGDFKVRSRPHLLGSPALTSTPDLPQAMNVMLPYDEGACTAEEPMLIDFASTGVGLGMCDVAMLLAHSVSPTTLAGGGQERLIDAYLDALEEKGVTNYDRSTAMRHFHLATVDYARFVVSRFWTGASAAAFAKRAANPNVCLPNRDVEAALRFAERVDASLTVLDGGGGTCC